MSQNFEQESRSETGIREKILGQKKAITLKYNEQKVKVYFFFKKTSLYHSLQLSLS